MAETEAFNTSTRTLKAQHNAPKHSQYLSGHSKLYDDHFNPTQSECGSNYNVKREGLLPSNSSSSSSPTAYSTHQAFGKLMASDETTTNEDIFSMYIDIDKMNSETMFVSNYSNTIATTNAHSLDARNGCDMDNGNDNNDHNNRNNDDEEDYFVTPNSIEVIKKAMAADKLAELALVDPKRAKRILANRQSAARSKERKTRYIAELEAKVQSLQTQATTLSAQLAMLQRDYSGLTYENGELKLQLESMEHQVQFSDAMNTSLREEIEKLKVMTGQLSEGNEEIIAMDQIEQALFTCTSRLRGQASFQENVFGGIPTTTRYMKDAMPAS